METELFTWVDWDIVDEDIMQFQDITLVIPIGNFNKGEKFSYAVINTQKGILILGLDNTRREFKFKLHFRVGEIVK